ncbi:glutaminase domain-containing protein [Draconibacterium orientale]|uniref:glutaminase family protein n=1 Tax=Draconibacterium orientale TaxID=1168034 RepID=UPI002ABE0D06|nr:DUF4965 domain-containing protein [Draconibacterium orientale]
MKRLFNLRIPLLLIIATLCVTSLVAQNQEFRAPSYPLVTHDPYFSIWINNEVPTQIETTHWSQKPMPIRSVVKVDGKAYRLMGKSPAFVPAAKLTKSNLSATQTTFSFQQDGVEISMNFLSPILIEDLDMVSRPLTYVSWEINSIDGEEHNAEIYFEISALAAVNTRGQRVNWQNYESGELQVLKVGNVDQPVLEKSGDDIRIDWGYLYAAANTSSVNQFFAGRSEDAIVSFVESGKLPGINNEDQGSRVVEGQKVLAYTIPVTVKATGKTEKHIMLAYDDIFSVEYFGKRLEGYWKKKFKNMDQLLTTAEQEYTAIKKRCDAYDLNLNAEAESVGGKEYATICALAYRQSIAAHKVVKDENGEPLCFSKENFSNGSMGTVDVFYPAAPIFLYLNPDLIKAQTTPIFQYAESGRWPWPYAPHDIGKYPLGNGQKYGGGEKTEDRQMPVEECGNMLILTAAIAKTENDASYAKKYWDTITKWAEYLSEKGFDPDNQLCTDDFAGHLAHNANLSVKAIMGLASYSLLCEMQGMKIEADNYMKQAQEMVQKWMKAADDGDHYRLAFDAEGSWSQKYNMVWDDMLGFHIFPEEVENKEISYYLKVQNRYGLPLDNRDSYTKLDWILWTASLANSKQEFNQLVAPVYRFLNETPERVPMTDWYYTKTGGWRGFIARSVVGGVYMELLKEKLK